MRTLILCCLASLAACASSNRSAVGMADGVRAPDACCGDECTVRAECRPDGTCLITCTADDGSQCECVVDCDDCCDGSDCTDGPCDMDVECLPNGSCRITCTGDDGSKCETTVECGTRCPS